ncbi:MAG TPA: M48 family metalloprotease [Gemmatimonadaceae bacterium]|nr:M48 family metalloprotease [Gemmatimonadaceae bacterium]HRQ77533.1 M48 family metalloprotease [Gemmatimonadaceae bacterium]
MLTRKTTLALLLAGAIVAACAINPATGRRELMMISEDQEIAMGREYDPQLVAEMGLVPDSALQRYVRTLGMQMATKSERPNLPWTFRVVDDPVVNAFAVPGGFVYITRGILAHFNSEAQLVAVLGHEIGHVTARHSAAQMSRAQLAQVGLAVGSAVSERFAQMAELGSAGVGILFLKYGRDDETQADALGLRYMRRSGHDVREMPGVYAMLASLSGDAGRSTPDWLSTHPAPEDRQARIQRAIAAMPQDSLGSIVERDSYLRRLEGLTYGPNPRHGYFVGQTFNHPDMRFTMTFPEGWATQNATQSVTALSAEKNAMIQLTLSRAPSADSALRAFAGQQGLQAGTVSRPALRGFASSSAMPFAALVESDTLRGRVLFVEHGGVVLQLIAYGPAAGWTAQQAVAERALGSFAVLTDRAALEVQPRRVSIVRVDRAMTITQMRAGRASALSAAELAVINQVRVDEVLPVGRMVKWVVGS